MSNIKPWILYVAPFSFPIGGAAARRVLGNCSSLGHAGFKVCVLSTQFSDDAWKVLELEENLSVVYTGERRYEHLPSNAKRLRYIFSGKGMISWILKQDSLPSAIILYGGYVPFFARLMPFCKSHSLPLIFDAVEWYTPKSLFHFLVSPYLWNVEMAMRFLVPGCDGIIAISSFLQSKYKALGLPTARVPPTMNLSTIKFSSKRVYDGPRLKLCYTGSAYYDHLGIIISVVRDLRASGVDIELNVAGPTRQEVICLIGADVDSEASDAIVVHGRLSHEKSLTLLSNCDYSVFLRAGGRACMAGFPTKFVESMAVGTPVITNLSSDIGRYLIDGKSGFVCTGPTALALKDSVLQALDVDRNDKLLMRQEARSLAEHQFDTRLYSDTLRKLLNSVGVDVSEARS